MEILQTTITGLLLIRPKVFGDSRGYFLESYNQEIFRKSGIDAVFLQDNQSLSSKGTIRGLHFQKPPHAQGKLVRVIRGAAFDVAVDIRKGSPTYGKWFSVELNEENKLMFWIPEGFAHGFQSLEDNTLFFYKCTGLYHRESEGSIRWDDPDLGIPWPLSNPVLSEKDKKVPFFRNFISPFS